MAMLTFGGWQGARMFRAGNSDRERGAGALAMLVVAGILVMVLLAMAGSTASHIESGSAPSILAIYPDTDNDAAVPDRHPHQAAGSCHSVGGCSTVALPPANLAFARPAAGPAHARLARSDGASRQIDPDIKPPIA